MKPQELFIIGNSLQLKNWDNPRDFQIAELTIALSIFNKLKEFTEDGKFIEWDPDFTSEEKVFIKKLVEERNWHVQDWEFVVSVLEKIK